MSEKEGFTPYWRPLLELFAQHETATGGVNAIIKEYEAQREAAGEVSVKREDASWCLGALLLVRPVVLQLKHWKGLAEAIGFDDSIELTDEERAAIGR